MTEPLRSLRDLLRPRRSFLANDEICQAADRAMAFLPPRFPVRDRARRLLPILEERVREVPPGILDCRRGCTTCCHQTVMLSVPEVLTIAAYLRKETPRAKLPALVKRLRDTGAQALRSPVSQRAIPCAFLGPDEERSVAQHRQGKAPADHCPPAPPVVFPVSCTIYPVRPLVCAGQNSVWAALCEPAEPIRLRLKVLEDAGTALAAALVKAEHRDRRAVRVVELASAVALALDPEAEALYLAGDDVFHAADALVLCEESAATKRGGTTDAWERATDSASARTMAHMEATGRREALEMVRTAPGWSPEEVAARRAAAKQEEWDERAFQEAIQQAEQRR